MRLRIGPLLVCLLLPACVAHTAEPEGASHELLFKWFNFILLVGALAYFAHKPFRRYVAGRRRAIQAGIEESRQLRARADQQVNEINQRLARLEETVSTMRRQAAAEAAAEEHRIREAAEREAERIRLTAQAEIASTLRAGRLELKAYAARLAVNLAEERMRRRLDPDAHAALFQVFVENLGRR